MLLKVYTFLDLNNKHSTNMDKINVTMKPKGIEMDINRQEFALALKMWRLRQNLTQKQVGERWGTSRYTILRAESGRNISWEQAYRLFAMLAKELKEEKL